VTLSANAKCPMPNYKGIGEAEFRERGSSGEHHASFDQRGSTLVIVLWIAFGLVSLTLYFGQSMSFELRASDNRVCGLAAEQAIDGAARYVSCMLANQLTNGLMPDPTAYVCEAVPVGDAHFWIIGRDTNNTVGAPAIAFGLVDEASKVNLNTATSNMLAFLPNMNLDLTQAILDWRDTNGGSFSQTYYAMLHPPYQCKCAPFETVDELRLLYGADMDTLVGEDANRNGILDPNENDQNHDGLPNPGVLEYVTVYSREPITNVDGSVRLDIHTVSSTSSDALRSLLATNLTDARAEQILQQLGLVAATPSRPGAAPTRGATTRGNTTVAAAAASTQIFRSPLEFYLKSGMTVDEFGAIANKITVTNGGGYIRGRVNVNTASAAVLACLPGISDTPDLAQTLITYRQSNPDKLASVAWVADALGQNNSSTLSALQTNDCITTLSYQFSADVAALGPHGRGYRRTLFVFDTVDGTPKVIYRKDRTHLGWALGKDVRQAFLGTTIP
jgi:DNA uptake protein ComE-like DNA-binding protein